MKCPKCNGKGVIYRRRQLKTDKPMSYNCNFCKGKSDLDWIENIFGVENEMPKM